MSLTAFVNEPILELRRSSVRAQLLDALNTQDGKLPLRVPVWIGKDQRLGSAFTSTDPCNPSRIVAEVASATADEIDLALLSAGRGAREWAATSAEKRAEVL